MYELKGWFIAIVGTIVALAAMGAIMGGTIGIIVLAFKLAYGVFVWKLGLGEWKHWFRGETPWTLSDHPLKLLQYYQLP